MLDFPLVILSLAFLAGFALVDYKTRRIPNRLMLVPTVFGIVVYSARAFSGDIGILTSGVCLFVTLLLWRIKAFGGADAKTLFWMFLILNPVLVWAALFNCYLLLPAFFKQGGKKGAPMLVPLFAGLVIAIPFGNIVQVMVDYAIARLV